MTRFGFRVERAIQAPPPTGKTRTEKERSQHEVERRKGRRRFRLESRSTKWQAAPMTEMDSFLPWPQPTPSPVQSCERIVRDGPLRFDSNASSGSKRKRTTPLPKPSMPQTTSVGPNQAPNQRTLESAGSTISFAGKCQEENERRSNGEGKAKERAVGDDSGASGRDLRTRLGWARCGKWLNVVPELLRIILKIFKESRAERNTDRRTHKQRRRQRHDLLRLALLNNSKKRKNTPAHLSIKNRAGLPLRPEHGRLPRRVCVPSSAEDGTVRCVPVSDKPRLTSSSKLIVTREPQTGLLIYLYDERAGCVYMVPKLKLIQALDRVMPKRAVSQSKDELWELQRLLRRWGGQTCNSIEQNTKSSG
ncbi:predicted protein [Uncinocarpus reesii 1704]|uniref:Uncharacterized protein n=1 Tax=Uncinocarpus reesii (strain UAMH 1704) TaxID=336963 RepID=C4JRH5_UNCRE|nr:uncharacterized protein UREG_05064 [Uncinocarpus reesii 1704]EEP80222.1 predicted protein [Uncinocarpus reesii 1704]